MSAIIEVLLLCDGGNDCPTDELFGVDEKHSTAKLQRRFASAEGWTYSGGKDYCPECSERRKLKKQSRCVKNAR